jgi:hypothetical protein
MTITDVHQRSSLLSPCTRKPVRAAAGKYRPRRGSIDVSSEAVGLPTACATCLVLLRTSAPQTYFCHTFTTIRRCRGAFECQCQQIPRLPEFVSSLRYVFVFALSPLPQAKHPRRPRRIDPNPGAQPRPVRLPRTPPNTWERRPARAVTRTFTTPGRRRRTGRPH